MKEIWREIAQNNDWPDPVLVKNMTDDRLPGFPYSRGGFRNVISGRNADKSIADKTFYVGKLAAVRRGDLVDWLNERTKNRN